MNIRGNLVGTGLFAFGLAIAGCGSNPAARLSLSDSPAGLASASGGAQPGLGQYVTLKLGQSLSLQNFWPSIDLTLDRVGVDPDCSGRQCPDPFVRPIAEVTIRLGRCRNPDPACMGGPGVRTESRIFHVNEPQTLEGGARVTLISVEADAATFAVAAEAGADPTR